MNKYVSSIDGFFKKKIKIVNLEFNKRNFSKKNTILGKGNSISQLPYVENFNSIELNVSKEFFINEKKQLVTVSGNAKISDVHNFLLKNKYYCHYFPSYPLVTVGACIANGTHGIIPKKGIFTDFVREIELYNPNFGKKILSKSKNKKIFELTKCGFGLTGIIISAKLQIFKIKSTSITVKHQKVKNLIDCYRLIKNSKYLYNQNTFVVDYSKNNIFLGRVFFGFFSKKEFNFRKIKDNKIYNLRLGLLNLNFIKISIYKISFLIEKLINIFSNKKHINDILFTSNKKTIYFNLMPNKFIEYQNIVPEKNVDNYLKEFERIIVKHKPKITLIHLKKFDKDGKNFEFKKRGLAIAIHIVINENFNAFYKDLTNLDFKNKCIINFYKNSLVDLEFLKKVYPTYSKKFIKNIKKINKRYKFSNSIFKNYF
jgi:decaprenylphospho-beta-D-ribofuranose 2-oxidase